MRRNIRLCALGISLFITSTIVTGCFEIMGPKVEIQGPDLTGFNDLKPFKFEAKADSTKQPQTDPRQAKHSPLAVAKANGLQ